MATIPISTLTCNSWRGAALGLLAGGAALTLARFVLGGKKRGATSCSALSVRGAPLVQGHGPPCYIMEHIMRLGAMYCPESRPDGYICLAISENRLAYPLLSEALVKSRPTDISSTGYDNPRGAMRFRQAIASFLSEHVAKRPVHMDSLASTAGATAVLHNVLFAIADLGDVCLIPSPYYTGFDSNLSDPRVGLVPFCVPCPSLTEIDLGISVKSLEKAFTKATREHGRVSVLLLTSPHNPTGLFYSEHALRGAVSWAQTHGIQVVCDEVYSNTLFAGEKSAGFKSMLELYSPLPEHVHVCWGLSKIFGIAGWRVGVLISENSTVMEAFCSLLHPLEVSTDTLHSIAGLLETPGFSHQFLADSQVALKKSFEQVQKVCAVARVPLVVPQAGLYVLIDLRNYLRPPAGFAEEEWLWKDILAETNLNLTPGHAMHCAAPGWFRVCFAAQPPKILEVALARLAAYLGTQH